ncbi:MAG: NAD(P)H-dependent oxidoreductase [Treponema sp.]|jgi:NAD(P)H dehydrogenase (quinone)|nr:NAD(P)H-dependent oxidoreductase [Treponema sp.]
MHVFIVYAHPCEDSFSSEIRDSFIRGLESAGHSFTVSDLYRMNFNALMCEAEYRREAFYRGDLPVPQDVAEEQKKINNSDALVFICPLFWSDVPAILKGWFDRVWTYGFAYGENTEKPVSANRDGPPGQGRLMKRLEKGLYLLSAGNTMEYFNSTGILAAMKKVLLDDRLFDRVRQKELVIFEGTSREMPSREEKRTGHLERAFRCGALLF